MHVGPKDTIGVFLRNVRQNRKITLQEVSDETGINLGVLQALEEEDRARLPAEVYIKAFYKKYADFLKLNSEEFSQFSGQLGGGKKEKQETKYSFHTLVELKNTGENLYNDSIRLLVIVILIILLGVLLYWSYKTNFNPLDFKGFLHDLTEMQDFDYAISV
jgi:cytoskeletal protein RodZ